MNEMLNDALQEVRDTFIAEAAKPKKTGKMGFFAAIAAVLVLAILLNIPGPSVQPPVLESTGASQSSSSTFPESSSQPTSQGSSSSSVDRPVPPNIYMKNAIRLASYSNHRPIFDRDLATQLADFFGDSMHATLGKDQGTNKAYSPANLYLALSVLSELSDGNVELMELLGVENLQLLRNQANRLWNTCYVDEKDQILLANALWLEENVQYNPNIMDTLADNYFTDSFYGDLGSKDVNEHIADWLNVKTGNLLQEQTQNIQLDPDTVFALYSTLYFRVRWQEEFHEGRNTQGTFYGSQESTVTYMHRSDAACYYRGSNFTAVCWGLRFGGMWLILPNEGVAPEELLESREYLELVLGDPNRSPESILVNLSLPKFDIQTNSSLKEDLESLGVHEIFDSQVGPFRQFLQTNVDGDVYVDKISQATRVCVDEEGVTAVNYVQIQAPSEGLPPEEEVDFVLDRPFLFVVTNSADIPLFAGIVNDLS